MTVDIDAHIGGRLRQRRWMLGLTQSQVGDRIGIKFQQIQKYETAQNRVSARRLWALSQALDVPVSFFFEGVDTDGAILGEDGVPASFNAAQDRPTPGDLVRDRDAVELVRAYYTLAPEARARLLDFLQALERRPAAAAPERVGAARTTAAVDPVRAASA